MIRAAEETFVRASRSGPQRPQLVGQIIKTFLSGSTKGVGEKFLESDVARIIGGNKLSLLDLESNDSREAIRDIIRVVGDALGKVESNFEDRCIECRCSVCNLCCLCPGRLNAQRCNNV